MKKTVLLALGLLICVLIGLGLWVVSRPSLEDEILARVRVGMTMKETSEALGFLHMPEDEARLAGITYGLEDVDVRVLFSDGIAYSVEVLPTEESLAAKLRRRIRLPWW